MDAYRLSFNLIVNGIIRATRRAPSAAEMDAARAIVARAAVDGDATRAAYAVIVNRGGRHATRDAVAFHRRLGAGIVA